MTLRTPDSAFENIADYPFAPNYHEAEPDVRMHYVDEGSGRPILLLHGEPTWSYLYRHMIPPLVAAGYRTIAPDLIGFGKSDKLASRDEYTYAKHVGWMESLVVALDLQDVVLFGHDWGGLIGLRVMANQLDRFKALAVTNTGLPTGEHQMPQAFADWVEFSQKSPVFSIGRLIQNATTSDLDPQVLAAYDAPFPDDSFKEAARIFPSLVPARPDMAGAAENKLAWEKLMGFTGPTLTMFSDTDPITAGGAKPFEKLIPGAAGQPHITTRGGHFVQEDSSPELAAALISWLGDQ